MRFAMATLLFVSLAATPAVASKKVNPTVAGEPFRAAVVAAMERHNLLRDVRKVGRVALVNSTAREAHVLIEVINNRSGVLDELETVTVVKQTGVAHRNGDTYLRVKAAAQARAVREYGAEAVAREHGLSADGSRYVARVYGVDGKDVRYEVSLSRSPRVVGKTEKIVPVEPEPHFDVDVTKLPAGIQASLRALLDMTVSRR